MHRLQITAALPQKSYLARGRTFLVCVG